MCGPTTAPRCGISAATWRTPTPDGRSAAGVLVGRRRQRLGNARRPRVVPDLVDDGQLAAGPGVVETPDGAEEVAEVETALDEGAGNVLEQGRVPQDHAFVVALAEEAVVAPVVRDRPGEAHAELR